MNHKNQEKDCIKIQKTSLLLIFSKDLLVTMIFYTFEG